MRRRPPEEEEFFDDEDELYDDEDERAPLSALPARPVEPIAGPPPAPALLIGDGRRGPVLPDPLPLPEGGVRLRPTRSYQIFRLRSLATTVLISLAVVVGVLALITQGDLTRVEPLFYGYVAFLQVVIVIANIRAPQPVQLKIDAEGITFDHDAYILKAGWAQVAGIVQIGGRPEALTLRLTTSSVTWERPSRVAPWRKSAFPWDQTVLLFPFIRGDAEQLALRYLAGALPRLQGVPAIVEAAVAQPAGRRAAAAALVIIPGVVMMLAVSAIERLSTLGMGLNLVLVAAYLTTILVRHRGFVGERNVDFIARVLFARDGQERRSEVAKTIGRAYLGWAFWVAMGYLVFAMSPGSPTASLQAKYGPPHTCWKDDAGKIVGCRMDDGRVLGLSSATQATCFFTEPLAADTRTFHCAK